jgi:hypothetical protein
VDSLDNLLVVDLSAEPSEVYFPAFLIDSQFNLPERLRDKLLQLLCLVYAEAKSRRLAWPKRDWDLCVAATTSECFLQVFGLEAREGDSDFEVEDLASVD